MQIRYLLLDMSLARSGTHHVVPAFPIRQSNMDISWLTRPHAVTDNRQKAGGGGCCCHPHHEQSGRSNAERVLPSPSTSTLSTPQATTKNAKSTTHNLTAVIPHPHNLDMPSPLGDPWCGLWTIMVQPGVNWVSDYILTFLEYLFGKCGTSGTHYPSRLQHLLKHLQHPTNPTPTTLTPVPPPSSPSPPPPSPAVPPPPPPSPPVPPLPPPPRPNPELDTLRALLESFLQASATERSAREAERVAERKRGSGEKSEGRRGSRIEKRRRRKGKIRGL
ncbi:hypothetical protein BGX38DRAFT_1335197 [Terfezia claveryi]|nr:hypothetical protein BGX38DRAFT_1335197 [Terfezia claveryi]